MVRILFIILMICPLFSFGQGTLEKVQAIIKSDNEMALKEYLLSGKELDECYTIKESAYSMLVLSIKHDSPKIFAACLEAGSDVDLICDEKTPLMYAVKYNKSDYLKTLLKKGADKNFKNAKGRTASDYAKKYKRPGLLKVIQDWK